MSVRGSASRRRGLTLGVVTALVVAAAGGGVMVANHLDAPEPKAAARGLPAAPEPTPPRIPRPIVPPGTVVATGDITASDGATTGTLTITAVDGNSSSAFALVVPTFSTSHGADLQVVASAAPVPDDASCLGTGLVYPVGSLASLRRSAVSISNGISGGDPSFVDTLALVTASADEACVAHVVALAQMHWDMPDLRPDLLVADEGAAPAAAGPVALAADSSPQDYVVVDGDEMGAIADRFGVSIADLLYLNPGRQPLGDRVAHAGETLNLSKARR